MKEKSAKMILINPEGKIFLLHRENIPTIQVPNKWSFVGGGVEQGETPLEGAIRETKEEINFDATNVTFFKKYDNPDVTTYVHVATINKDIQDLTLTEGDDMGFFTIKEALNMSISNNTRRYINDYFSEH